jgi:hypothetical protein
MRQRIQQELTLLRRFYGDVEYAELNGEDWFKLPSYLFPNGWRVGETAIEQAPIVFRVGPAYPTQPPYAFCVPAGVTFNGKGPDNSSGAPPTPFAGSWLQLSWQPDGDWTPKTDAEGGSNLYTWARSFINRLKEGA